MCYSVGGVRPSSHTTACGTTVTRAGGPLFGSSMQSNAAAWRGSNHGGQVLGSVA